MKKIILLSALLGAVILSTTSCGKSGATSDGGTSTSTDASTDANAGEKLVTDIFGGNLFWGVKMTSSKSEVAKISIPGTETNHDEIGFEWSKENKDHSGWVFSVYLDDKGEIDSYTFDYTASSNKEAQEFGLQLNKAIEAKDGKHINEETADDTMFEWESGKYEMSLLLPDKKDSKDVVVTYRASFKEEI